ncbi:MAG: LysR family transcriptional regulator [Eubacteriaceae bacterium]|jgi:DNA-binding transcriptional LysR family regulator
MLDFRMNTFLEVCRTMNYRAAAASLNMTQPAVTQHIQYLEREYGCRLFIYDGRVLHKTEEAEMLERYTEAALINDLEFRERVKDTPPKPLLIGATKTIGEYVLYDYLTEFSKNSGAEFSLVIDNTEHLLQLLEKGKLDFALIEGAVSHDFFSHRRWKEVPFIGLCATDHPFAGQDVSWKDVVQETLILREQGSGTRTILEHQMYLRGYSTRSFERLREVSSPRLIARFVREGQGISFGYDPFLEDGLASFTVESGLPAGEFHYVWLSGTSGEEKIEQFERFSGMNIQDQEDQEEQHG